MTNLQRLLPERIIREAQAALASGMRPGWVEEHLRRQCTTLGIDPSSNELAATVFNLLWNEEANRG